MNCHDPNCSEVHCPAGHHVSEDDPHGCPCYNTEPPDDSPEAEQDRHERWLDALDFAWAQEVDRLGEDEAIALYGDPVHAKTDYASRQIMQKALDAREARLKAERESNGTRIPEE